MLKVLFVVAATGNSEGMSPFIYSQAKSLEDIGCNVDFFLIKGLPILKYIFAASQINKLLKKNKYSIVHAHYSYSAFSATFQYKTPLVVSFLGSDLHEKSVINSLVNRRVLAKAKKVIVKTREMQFLIPEIKSEIVPNGVNLQNFYPVDKSVAKQKLGLSSDVSYVLFAANPSRKEKNFELAKKSADLCKSKRVELLPVFNIPNNELYVHYNACDLLLLTSHHEGSVNVVKEAMACNCPIVSVDVGDVRENLTNVKNCYVVERNETEISKSIEKVISDGERSNGREYIQNLSVEVIAKKLYEIYKGVLNVNE